MLSKLGSNGVVTEFVVIDISHSGIGISTESAARVLQDDFFDKDLNREIGCYGRNLRIARVAMENIGGSMEISFSKSSQITTFRIMLQSLG